jgi:hypothetical protein
MRRVANSQSATANERSVVPGGPTPNGLAPFYLLRDWGEQLGITGIDEVVIWKPGPGLRANRQVHMTISYTPKN